MEIAAQFVKLVVAAAFAVAVFVDEPYLVNAQIPAPDARHYRNVDYQFSLDLPQGFSACVSERTNHGVYIVLTPGTRCGGENDQMRYIGIFANYNVGSETRTRDHLPARTPAQLARIYCPSRERRAIEWLYEVTFGGRKAAGCRQCFENGRISVWLVTLRKTAASADGWIEVSAYLQTTAARYRSDRRIFRRVLKTVWIHPDGPLK